MSSTVFPFHVWSEGPVRIIIKNTPKKAKQTKKTNKQKKSSHRNINQKSNKKCFKNIFSLVNPYSSLDVAEGDFTWISGSMPAVCGHCLTNFNEVLICHPRKTREEKTQCRSSLFYFLLTSHIKIGFCAHKRQNMLQMQALPAEAVLLQKGGHSIYTGGEDNCGQMQQNWTLLKASALSECKVEAKAYKLLDILWGLTIILFILAVIRPHCTTSSHKPTLL